MHFVRCAAAPLRASAQGCPSKPIRMIVPFPPDGAASVTEQPAVRQRRVGGADARPVFDAERLRRWSIPTVRRRFTRSGTILYAFGLGLGSDPCSADELRSVDEHGLLALPSFGTVLAHGRASITTPD